MSGAIEAITSLNPIDDAPNNGGSMSNVRTTIVTDKTTPGYWRVTLDNPPINAIDRQQAVPGHKCGAL